jgi:hypothetical protein
MVRLIPDGSITNPQASVSAMLDINGVPVPDKKYVADVYSVTHAGRAVKLYFGQSPVPGGDLHTLLVINMSMQSVQNCVTVIDQVKGPSFDEVRDRESISPAPIMTIKQIPAQTVTLSATLAVSAMAGQDAAIDFLRSSPFAIAIATKTSELAVDPVVRVEMSSEIFIGLVDQLRRVASTAPPPVVEKEL